MYTYIYICIYIYVVDAVIVYIVTENNGYNVGYIVVTVRRYHFHISFNTTPSDEKIQIGFR